VEDLEKELGPLIKNFQNLVKDAKAKKLDSLREDEDLKKEFNELSQHVIEPVMRKFESYLESKDVNSSVHIQSEIVAEKNLVLNSVYILN
jgi:phosphoenolpyruvate carboxylase